MELVLVLVPIFATIVLVGLYYENRRQTDALNRIAKALAERDRER